MNKELTLAMARLESLMEEIVLQATNDHKLAESMLYSLKAGGKRIRPRIFLATLQAFGSSLDEEVLKVAAAIEMMHTYSLIHDDLPSIDNDDLRRGKPTNHKVFGEAIAIFAGDALLTLCFEVLSQVDLPASTVLQLIQQLSQAAGPAGIVAGQASDVQAENQQVSLKQLMAIHERKTGALLQYCFVAAGLVAQANSVQLASLSDLGMKVGIAFQVRDDLLDILATTEELGKTAGRDLALEKSTYPALLGIQGAKEALAGYLSQARKICQDLANQGLAMDELVKIIEKLELRD
nr:farnesyl diphosphate synthase [Enterococcus cecorum]